MTNMQQNEEPGFETDVDELPAQEGNNSADTLEDSPIPSHDRVTEMERVQQEAAEERKEGGYQ